MNGHHKFICMISVPRTGSNHLCSAFAQFESILGFFEIFHADRAFGMSSVEVKRVAEHLGIQASDPTATIFRNTIRKHPGLTLDAIKETLLKKGVETICTFKVFPGHLSSDVLNDEVFDRDDTSYMIIRRRTIDTYISHVKAEKLGRYAKIDTTDLKPILNFSNFRAWIARTSAWYENCARTLEEAGRKYDVMSYEEHINRPIDELSLFLAERYQLKYCRNEQPENAFVRQDRSNEISDRVANWPQFEKKLARKGLLQTALSYPF